jgi:Mg-chelatase subunit ChlD
MAFAASSGQLLAENAVARQGHGGNPARDLPFDWATDVAAAPDGGRGDIAVLNNEYSQVMLLNLRMTTTPRYSAALAKWWRVPDNGRRLAFDGQGSVYVLFDDGLIREYDAHGAPMASWRLDGAEHPRQTYGDIAVAGSGDVIVADTLRGRILLYGPLDAGADQEGSRMRCAVYTAKQALPDLMTLGQATQVTLGVDGQCPEAADPADIVLVIDAFDTEYELLDDRVADAMALVGEVDLSRHRVAVVHYTATAQTALPLSMRREDIDSALRTIRPAEPPEDPEDVLLGYPRLDLALAEAATALSGAESQDRKALVVIWGWDNPCLAFDPDDAGTLHHTGARIGVVETLPISEIYGGAWDVMELRARLTAAMLDMYWRAPPGNTGWRTFFDEWSPRQIATELLTVAAITDTVPINMRYVAGSASPAAIWDSAHRELSWQLEHVPFSGITLTYELEPQLTGRWPTNIEARVRYTDGLNASGFADFPVPQVSVLAPTATTSAVPSTAPTATPSHAPTAVPTLSPTPTVAPSSLYLPVALSESCKPNTQRADVVLAMDASTSMLDATPSGRTKLEEAQTAALALVDGLNLALGDHVAVIAFNRDAVLLAGLSSDRSSLEAALGAVHVAKETCLPCAVEAAVAELSGPRHTAGHTAAMVILTDGLSNPRPASDAVVIATDAKAAGIAVFTVGLGAVLDEAALAQMASHPGAFFRTLNASDLARIYAEIAGEIPCPPHVFWGG